MFKYKTLPNLAVIWFELAGYALGLWLLAQSSGATLALSLAHGLAGVLLLASVKIQAAYLFHEFAHGTIFKRAWANEWGGKTALWLTGNWMGFKQLQVNHIQHHVKKADFLVFDHAALLEQRPGLRRLIDACEWAYLPALEFLIRFEASRRALASATGKARIAFMLASRGGLFLILWRLNPWALPAYFTAFVLMIHGLRFMDTHQHTYSVHAPGSIVPDYDKAYEQAHTFSNYFARWRGLNWLTLNFGYHNAHHAKPALPWHDLPAQNENLDMARHYLPGESLVYAFHAFRVQRIMVKGDFGNPWKAREFIGASGVSFLNL